MSNQPPPPSATAAHDLLKRAFPPEQATDVLLTKVINRPFPLLPTEKPDARDARRTARHAKPSAGKLSKKPKPLSAKQKRALGVYDIKKKDIKYEIFQPLRELWNGYARELVALGGGAPGVASRMAGADFHGAEIEVVRSRDVGRVGIKGIVVKETRGVFEVVTKDKGVKTVPKEHTVFRFEVPGKDAEGKERIMVMELQGEQFMFRAAERAGRKFKVKPMLDI
jgi:ribonuclease P protein subunit POP4